MKTGTSGQELGAVIPMPRGLPKSLTGVPGLQSQLRSRLQLPAGAHLGRQQAKAKGLESATPQ